MNFVSAHGYSESEPWDRTAFTIVKFRTMRNEQRNA